MRNVAYLMFAALALAALLGTGVRVDAEKNQPGALKPNARKIDEKEVKEAKAALDAIDRKTVAALSGLRYLLRSEFEDDLFDGRWRETCPMEPFDKLKEGPLDAAEQLRLWVVLETGLARNAAIDNAFKRLALTPAPEVKNELAPAGLYMLVLRSAVARMTVTEAAKLLDLARQTAAAAKKAADVCAPQSVWISSQMICPEWFSNHFWRAVINRCTLDLGQGAEFKQWGRDLDFLGRIYVEGQGWTSKRNQAPDASEDLNANLLAMATFGLAAGAPPGQMSKSDLREIETAVARMPAVITRLEKTYPQEPLNGARLALVMAAGAAPKDHADPVGWRNALLLNNYEAMGGNSVPSFRTGIPAAFGLTKLEGRRDTLAEVSEVAFGLICANGGFLRSGEGPLARMELAEVGRLMHALATVEAASAPSSRPLSPTQQRAADALEKARKYLVESQNPDGSFQGDTWGGKEGTGAQCMAVLALLHAGEPRDSVAVKRAMKYLEGRNFVIKYETYEASVQLMLLEKYFEKEIAQAGMYDATNLAEYNKARNKLVELMPRAYRELAKNLTRLLLDKRVFDLDGFNYACGNEPKYPTPPAKTPNPANPPKFPPNPRPATPPAKTPDPNPAKTPDPNPAKTPDPNPAAPPKVPGPVTGNPPKTRPTPIPWQNQGGWDNSNSQFAMLGLKSACMLAIDVPSKVFRLELERLLGSAELDGDLPHSPLERPWKLPSPAAPKKGARQTEVPVLAHSYKFQYRMDWADFLGDRKTSGSGGSFGCTGGSLATIAVCFDELYLRGEWHGELETELERFGDHVLWGGLTWLSYSMFRRGSEFPNRWETDLTLPASSKFDGVGMYYDYWSLGRACTLLGATKLAGGNNWYDLVTQKICDKQMAQGGWGLLDPVVPDTAKKGEKTPEKKDDKSDNKNKPKPTLCNTAFAILALAKAAPAILSNERRGFDAPPRGPSKTSEPTAKPAEPTPEPTPTPEPKKGPATGER